MSADPQLFRIDPETHKSESIAEFENFREEEPAQ